MRIWFARADAPAPADEIPRARRVAPDSFAWHRRQRAALAFCASAIVIGLPLPAFAEDAVEPAVSEQLESPTVLPCRSRPTLPADRPRIGLVLGGGGARGIAHISILRALEEMRVPIDCIAGTSMGALAGALYASGMSVDELEELVLGLDWDVLFDDNIPRPQRSFRRKRDDDLLVGQTGIGINEGTLRLTSSLLGGERILLTFQQWTQPVAMIDDFDRLPIPYRAVAADLRDGKEVVLGRGNLALAMRASMSVPGAFPAVRIDDRVLVDGGIARNLPVEIVRAMGADIVIAVDVGTALPEIEETGSVLEVASQLAGLLTAGNTRASLAALGPHDILIVPELGNEVGPADFDRGPRAIEIGAAAVPPVRERLRALSVDEDQWAGLLAVRTGRNPQPPVVEFVRLENRSNYADAWVLARVDVPLGEPLDAEALTEQLITVFSTRTFGQATYQVVHEEGRTGVLLRVSPKPQGPNFVEFGLSTSANFDGRYDFNVRVGVLHAPFGEYGSEWRALLQLGDEPRLFGEIYQPFGPKGQWFGYGNAEYNGRKIDVFDDSGANLAQVGTDEVSALIGVGREFGNYGAATLGLRRGAGELEELIGLVDLPDNSYHIGEASLGLTLDRLDSVFLPREGWLLRNRYVWSRDSLGADVDFEQFDVDTLYARRFGDTHSVLVGARYHSTVSGEAPLQSLYRVGGFTRLVGYQPNERSGQHYALLMAGYNKQIFDVLGAPALVGTLFEYGNVWERRSDMDFDDGDLHGSVYLALDSWLGPIIFGWGKREGATGNLFLEVGNRL
jgi:NTE family protein